MAVDRDLNARLLAVIERAAEKYVAPDVGEQLKTLVSPEALGIVAVVIVAWVVGHIVGIGELIDIVIAVVGLFSIGLAVFSGLDELFAFATITASSDGDIDAAARHLAQAVAILGVQTVLALLLKGAAKIKRAPQPLPEPPRTPGWRYRPTVTTSKDIARGEGETSYWGDTVLAFYGDRADQDVTRVHEAVHRFLAPKFYFLRNFRVENRRASIASSSLVRYCEEALAHTIAEVRINGWLKVFVGIRFPVELGYVSILRAGLPKELEIVSDPAFGKGLVAEGAALIGKGWVSSFGFEVWFKAGQQHFDTSKMIEGRPGMTASAAEGTRYLSKYGVWP